MMKHRLMKKASTITLFMIMISALVSCGASSTYSLSMKDATQDNEKAVLQKLLIDDEQIGNVNHIVLTKIDRNKYQERKQLAYFSKKGNFQIHADVMFKNRTINASCEIMQEQPYCSVVILFSGSESLTCTCDF